MKSVQTNASLSTRDNSRPAYELIDCIKLKRNTLYHIQTLIVYINLRICCLYSCEQNISMIISRPCRKRKTGIFFQSIRKDALFVDQNIIFSPGWHHFSVLVSDNTVSVSVKLFWNTAFSLVKLWNWYLWPCFISGVSWLVLIPILFSIKV